MCWLHLSACFVYCMRMVLERRDNTLLIFTFDKAVGVAGWGSHSPILYYNMMTCPLLFRYYLENTQVYSNCLDTTAGRNVKKKKKKIFAIFVHKHIFFTFPNVFGLKKYVDRFILEFSQIFRNRAILGFAKNPAQSSIGQISGRAVTRVLDSSTE